MAEYNRNISKTFQNYSQFLNQMFYDRACEVLELIKPTCSTHKNSDCLQSVINALQQLSTAEPVYFLLSFISQKFSFSRKETHVRDIYSQIRFDMQKYEEVEKVSEANGTEAVVSTMYNSLSKFVLLRINLVDFYTALSVKEWKAFEEFVFPEYISLVKAETSLTQDIFTCCQRELRSLHLIWTAYNFICKRRIFDALLILKDLHDTLEGWFRIVDACAAPKQPQGFFLSFTKKSKNNQKFSLLIFLHNLYKSLLNKFSLYFSEALFPFIPHGEIQLTVNSYYNSSNSLIQSLHTFSRKTNVHLLAIVTNQRSLYDPFSGNDVNTATSSCEKDNKENRLEPLALCPKDKKLFELYMKQQVNELVQDHLKNYQDNRMKCLYNKLIDKTYFLAPLEADIFVAIVYERKVNERDTTIQNFINELTTSLKCSKVFSDMKNVCK